ncbi:hypothetical protein GCM10023092_06310 [Rurimicrobium arvi]|uniref:RHS repeat-associated core domain-containing protein n=2 Tax=Rurimicrobium arvi TaxID=2049916 RepID=A0ABP8MJF1_9BACT
MSNKIYATDLTSTPLSTISVANDQRSNMLASPSSFAAAVKYKSNFTTVTFAIDHGATLVPTTEYLYKLVYKLEGDPTMSAGTYSYTAYDTLVIGFNPDSSSAYQDVQLKTYPNLYAAKLTVLGVYNMSSGAPVSMTLPPPNVNFYVELSMKYQPYLKTHYLPADMALNTTQSYNATNKTLTVSWSPSVSVPFLGKVTPAQYELEWTYVDNYSSSGGRLDPSQVAYDFRNNATRILTDTLAYSIPLAYPKGYIVYRVRMVRVDQDFYNKPVYGVWSLPAATAKLNTLAYTSYFENTQPHTGDSVNWNYTIHFAEGGKTKHVVNYADGLLKLRQSLTRFNSSPNLMLTTEPIYDFEGRQSIFTIPTVISAPYFSYQKGVSVSSVTGQPYGPQDFDLKPALCPDEVVIPPFTTSSLANRYYSTLNTDTAGAQKFVPQAEGYPFVYTQLATGYQDRAEAIGGAGPALQVNAGHDIKIQYMQADQPDLNNLFGVNAGRASYYTKTMSKDQNGQLSLSVKDSKGRQIVSSLVGASVDTSQIAMIFNDEVPPIGNFRENKLADPTTNVTIGNQKKYSGSFFMDFAAMSNIKYEYDFKPYTVCPAPNYLGLSVKCTYEYDVHDACGVEILHKYGELGKTGVSTVATPPPFSEDTTLALEKGKYTVNKTLTIAKEDIVAAVDSFFVRSPKPDCLKTEDDFIREEIEKTQYPCPYEDACSKLKKELMDELHTDAKYGKWRPGGSISVLGGSTDPNINSIYDIPQFIPGGEIPIYRFQKPCVVSALNALVINRGGKTYRNIGGPVLSVTDNATGAVTEYTESNDIVNFFKDEIYKGSDMDKIAEALLPLHPEYCKLQLCFDDTLETRLKNLPNAAAAVKYGMFALEDLISKDQQLVLRMKASPFFFAHIEDSLRTMYKGTVRIDTMCAAYAFCMIDDGMAYKYASQFFRPQILALNFPEASVKDYYFDKLRTVYLFNRKKYVSMAKTSATRDCPPCDTNVRMKLIPDARIKVDYAADGSLADGPDGFLSGFTDTAALGAIRRFMEDAARYAAGDTTGLAAKGDSAKRLVKRVDSLLCSNAVDSIMKRMINCYPNPTAGARLKDSLLSLVSRGIVHNGIFLPEQVRACIVGAGLSLNDLCHPYLASYDYYDEGAGNKGHCLSSGFYKAMTEFFNQYDIAVMFNNANKIFNPFTPSWPSTNFFAMKLASAITGGSGPVKAAVQYFNTDSLYVYSFYRTGSDTVTFSFRSPNKMRITGDTTGYPFLGVGVSDSVFFKEARCFFDGSAATVDGYIGRFMFTAVMERSVLSGGVYKRTSGGFVSWTNGKLAMNDNGASDIAACIPCTEFRRKYNQFKDSMTLYGGYAKDHPYFSRAMRNYMNYTLRRVYAENQYNRFLVSCALADSLNIPAYGAMAVMTFPSTGTPSYPNFAAWNAAMAASAGVVGAALVEYWTGTTQTVYLDYDIIDPKDYKKFNGLVTAAGGTIKPVAASGVAGKLFVPWGTPRSQFLANTPFIVSDSLSVKLRPNPYRPDLFDFKLYTITDTSGKAWKVSRGTDSLVKNLYYNYVTNYWVPFRFATIGADYYKAKKRAYLSYVYRFQDSTMGKVLDTLQDYLIPTNVSPFGSTQVTYKNPQNTYRFTDLFYTDSSSRFPGYDTVKYILNVTQSVLGSGKIFLPVGMNTRIAMGTTGSGASLNLYRCADDLYWYRYFGPANKLFSMFIRVPQYIYKSTHPSFKLVGIRPATGDTAASSFDALITIPGSNDTITAHGTTNFDVAWTLRLRDVLLGNETNFSNEKDPPPSGEEGAELNCEQQLLRDNIYQARINYYNYIRKYREDLLAAFTDHVMSQVYEKLWIQYINMRFGTTLYSYDRSGNLIQTVPPEGVHKVDSLVFPKIDSLREANAFIPGALPAHTKRTQYEYSTANLCWKESTPDAGVRIRYYDKKGNVLLSQTARQRRTSSYTYFLYDQQNRLTETGETVWSMNCPYFDPIRSWNYQQGSWIHVAKPSPCACENLRDSTWEYCGSFELDFYDDASFNAQIRTRSRIQVVYTVYDSAYRDMSLLPNMDRQENLRSRIAASMYYVTVNPGLPGSNYDHAMHYSYDAAGNVKTLMREFPQLESYGHRYKRIDYDYDLWSGKVNMISYNRGKADQFYQKYDYDADNRITAVYTGKDGLIWTRDAAYTYYQHGPLARIDLGAQKVQGVDYAYTLQGWLKSINGDLADTLSDMGGDGKRSTITPKDVYASVIDYFNGDYKPIGRTAVSRQALPNKSLYNGNIARQSTDITPFGGLTTAYTYDQMNRIKRAAYANTKRDSALAYLNKYASSYKYDMDGNLKLLVRRDGAGDLMDSMKYSYTSNTNRMTGLNDYAVFSKKGIEDIPASAGTPLATGHDEDGFVINDVSGNLESSYWTIYGKPWRFTRRFPTTGGRAFDMDYGYDAAGQRTYKTESVPNDTGRRVYSTFYVREASGNILAEYNTERQYDKGAVIRVLRDIRDVYPFPATGLKHLYLTALDSLGMLQSAPVKAFITGRYSDTTLGLPASGYLRADPVLHFNFFSSSTGALRRLPAYAAATGKYPLGAALSRSLQENPSPQDVLTGMVPELFSQPDIDLRNHSLAQLAEQVPDLWADLCAENQITVSSAEDSAMVMSMADRLAGNPVDLGQRLNNYYMQDPTILDGWLNAVSADSVYTDPWYRQSGLEQRFYDALTQYGPRNAMDSAMNKGTDVADEGFYAYADWWSGSTGVLRELFANSQTNVALVTYAADPVKFLEGISGYDAIDSAVADLDFLDIGRLTSVLGDKAHGFDPTVSVTLEERGPVQTNQQISLSSHHIYGSSRVGLHHYWPAQSRSYWDFAHGRYDTLLNRRAAWYSYAANEVVDTNFRDPWGHSLSRTVSADHVLGLREYELTNHLGNVQSVVLDKRYIKTTGNGVRDRFVASLSAVYDYYPYGMLMPGRTTADTSTHCMTVMKEYKSTAAFPVAADLSKAVPIMGGSFTSTSGAVWPVLGVYGKSGGMTLDINVVPGDAIDVRVDVQYVHGYAVMILVEETTSSGVKRSLGGMNVNRPTLATISVRPSTKKITLSLRNMSSFLTPPANGLFAIAGISYDSLGTWSQWAPVQVCNKNTDKYEFGFNGQMKSNDIAGIGNFNTAEFWEYNTRTGRRQNLDPVVQISMSDYSVFRGNPILNSDIKGNTPDPSTHTASDGSVIAVYNDGDKGVYKHSNNKDGSVPNKSQIDRRHESSTDAGGKKMGETEYWDEFADLKTKDPVGVINYSDNPKASWNYLIDWMHKDAMKYELDDIAKMSKLHQKYDIKNNQSWADAGVMTGRLLNGKFATARSAGNYLAGLNGSTGTLFGAKISNTTYLKLAGALNVGKYTKINAVKIVTLGTAFGPPPYYGEDEYSGRRIVEGLKAGNAENELNTK